MRARNALRGSAEGEEDRLRRSRPLVGSRGRGGAVDGFLRGPDNGKEDYPDPVLPCPGRCLMAAERRAARLGEEFVGSYPDTLPGRLEWLADHLRIDRARFLRLMGLAPDEVEANLQAPWESIAEKWEDGARWVEELLCQLMALFGYDWRALANCLHQPAEAGARPELERVSRPAGPIG